MAEPRKPVRPTQPARPAPRTTAPAGQPPIGRYPDWQSKNPVRRTDADGEAPTPEMLRRGGRVKKK